MDNPATAAAAAPSRGAKGVKGLLAHKQPAFYILLVAGILAAAWYIRKREAGSAPADQTADTITPDQTGTSLGYGSDGASYYPGATGGGSGVGGVDTTGGYLGSNSPVESTNGFIYDPGTGMVYGALPDSQDYIQTLVPSTSASGGGVPDTNGVAVHAPTVVSQAPQASSVSWTCPAAFPNHGPNPGSCYRTVKLAKADGHGHGKGTWHVYRDGSWHQVS